MGFLSKLKVILHGIGTVGKIGAIAVSAVNPALAVLLSTVFRAMLEVEGAIPNGEDKKKVVLAVANAKEAELGIKLDPEQLSLLIDNLVAAVNDPKLKK